MGKHQWTKWWTIGLLCVIWWAVLIWMIVSDHLMPRNSLWLGSSLVTFFALAGWLWQRRSFKNRKGVTTLLIVLLALSMSFLAWMGVAKESVVEANGEKWLLREDGLGNAMYYVYKNAFVGGSHVPFSLFVEEPSLRKEAPLHPLDIKVAITEQGFRVFDVSLDEWIQSYNGYYWERHGERYLRAAEEWQTERQPAGMHFAEETNRMTYRLDDDKWTLPTMSAYLTVEDGKMRQLVCNYDDHSYSSQTFAYFEEMCALALRVFVPQLDEKEAQKWATQINKVGDENTFNSDKQYRSADTLPTDLFIWENVGVFSYVAIGAPLHFCVIPVDSELVESYQAAGVRIHMIDGVVQ